jgi:VanZ family protein
MLMQVNKITFVIWALAMGAVTVLALLPVQHLQLPVFDWWDKAQHVVAFVVLTGGALLLWPGASARVVIGMIAYGAAIELAQWAVGWRFAEWSDLAADTVGVAGAWLLVSGYQRVQVNKSGG